MTKGQRVRLNYNLDDGFGDAPLDNIWYAKIHAVRILYEFKRLDLISIGPPCQNLRQNQIWAQFPYCNFKLKIAGGILF